MFLLWFATNGIPIATTCIGLSLINLTEILEKSSCFGLWVCKSGIYIERERPQWGFSTVDHSVSSIIYAIRRHATTITTYNHDMFAGVNRAFSESGL